MIQGIYLFSETCMFSCLSRWTELQHAAMEEVEADQNIRCSSLRAAGKELHKNQAKNDNSTVAETMRMQ